MDRKEFRLDLLNGKNGFFMNGGAAGKVGDINNDGFDDIIVQRVKSHVVFGTDKIFNSSFNLLTLNGSNGFTINPVNDNDNLGFSIFNSSPSAGDVNDDGIDDLIIGAIYASPYEQYRAGQGYVIFGKSSTFDSVFNLTSLDGNNGFIINGMSAGNNLGWSATGAGDINGDGIDDLAVGAPSVRDLGSNGLTTYPGEVYVIFGNRVGFSSEFNVSSLNGNNGFIIRGYGTRGELGQSLSMANDVNGDSKGDIIIGSNSIGSNVIFGNNTFHSPFSISSLDGNNGFRIQNALSLQVSSGDVNGDGYTDLLLGDPTASPEGKSTAGAIHVVFGKYTAFSASIDADELDASSGFTIYGANTNNQLGRQLIDARGDINGDGYKDIVTSYFQFFSFSPISYGGASYVVFGKNNFSSVVKLSGLDGNNGFSITDRTGSNASSTSSTSIGDFNNDGYDDISNGGFVLFWSENLPNEIPEVTSPTPSVTPFPSNTPSPTASVSALPTISPTSSVTPSKSYIPTFSGSTAQQVTIGGSYPLLAYLDSGEMLIFYTRFSGFAGTTYYHRLDDDGYVVTTEQNLSDGVHQVKDGYYIVGDHTRPFSAVSINNNKFVFSFQGEDFYYTGTQRMISQVIDYSPNLSIITSKLLDRDGVSPTMTAKDSMYSLVYQSYDQEISKFYIYGNIYSSHDFTLQASFDIKNDVRSLRNPSSAKLSDGNLLVTWDTGGYGIYAQVYTYNGEAVTSEIQIDEGISLNTFAFSLNDKVGVTWIKYQDGLDYEVFVQIFNNLAAPDTPIIRVNSNSAGSQSGVSATQISNDYFAVTWESRNSLSDIKMQLFDLAGNKAGCEIKVNNYTNPNMHSRQENPVIASLRNDIFLIGWEGTSGTGSDEYGIIINRYNITELNYGACDSLATSPSMTYTPTSSPSPTSSSSPTSSPSPTVTGSITSLASTSSSPSSSPSTSSTPSPSPSAYGVQQITAGGDYIGTSGRDSLIIDSEENVLITTGDGGDKLVIKPHSNMNITVTDFDLYEDKVDLTNFVEIRSLEDLSITEGSAIIHLPDNQKVILEGLTPLELTNDDFVFASTNTEGTDSDGGSNTGIIVGATLGGVALLTLATVAVYKFYFSGKSTIKDYNGEHPNQISDINIATNVVGEDANSDVEAI